MSLRAYFAAIESGATAIARADLARELTVVEFEALGRARLLRVGAPFASWPCDKGTSGCGREILPGAGTAFLAVCEGSREEEDRCLDVTLDAADLARTVLDFGALTTTLRALYRLERAGRDAEDHAARADEPACLGEDRALERTRDVFFAARPYAPVLAAFLDARAGGARDARARPDGTRGSPPRSRPGTRVEVEVLADAIAVRQGKLSRETRLHLVPSIADTSGAEDAPEGPKAVRKPKPPPVRRGG